jgi:hypothetical protein
MARDRTQRYNALLKARVHCIILISEVKSVTYSELFDSIRSERTLFLVGLSIGGTAEFVSFDAALIEAEVAQVLFY